MLFIQINYGITTASSYTLSFRVRKNYGNKDWSPWSGNTIVYITDMPTYEPQQYAFIMAQEYNTLLDFVDRIRKVYGLTWTDSPGSVVAKQTNILINQYSYTKPSATSMLQKLAQIKTTVNNYATNWDYTNVKFDVSNNMLESNGSWFVTGTPELITASQNKNNQYNGRNYWKHIYEDATYLK